MGDTPVLTSPDTFLKNSVPILSDPLTFQRKVPFLRSADGALGGRGTFQPGPAPRLRLPLSSAPASRSASPLASGGNPGDSLFCRHSNGLDVSTVERAAGSIRSFGARVASRRHGAKSAADSDA